MLHLTLQRSGVWFRIPSFPVKSVTLGPCLYFSPRSLEMRSTLLCCLITTSDGSRNYREQTAL